MCKSTVMEYGFQHFVKEEAETYIQEVTCPRSHREAVAKEGPGLTPGLELFP